MSLLPVQAAHQIAAVAEERRWLIEGLWAEQGVGIVGGEPKCCKSFLALDMAVAVASGTPCLRRFPVPRKGRVLVFPAEDALHIVRRRLEGICVATGIALSELDLQVITAPSVRLDVEQDRASLRETVEALRPTLLILDPFVRLHRVDENVSGAVAPLLAYLRDLQRQYRLSVVVVHHARKGAGRARAGQALRGSSEFHAWGDSNLYMRRTNEQLTLTIEHRAAASSPALPLELRSDGEAVALTVTDTNLQPAGAAEPPPVERVESALATADAPLTVAALQKACRIRTATLCSILAGMVDAGRAEKTSSGYRWTER